MFAQKADEENAVEAEQRVFLHGARELDVKVEFGETLSVFLFRRLRFCLVEPYLGLQLCERLMRKPAGNTCRKLRFKNLADRIDLRDGRWLEQEEIVEQPNGLVGPDRGDEHAAPPVPSC